jgi:hypothetical protein
MTKLKIILLLFCVIDDTTQIKNNITKCYPPDKKQCMIYEWWICRINFVKWSV